MQSIELDSGRNAPEIQSAITFLRPSKGEPARKKHGLIAAGDGHKLETISYGNAKQFHHSTEPVGDISALFAALLSRSTNNEFAIRGSVIAAPGAVIRRLWKGDNPTIQDKPTPVVAIDLDKELAPDGLDRNDIYIVGAYLRSRLPTELQDVSCVIQLSGSYGLDRWKPGPVILKARLWFLNQTGITGQELRRWFKHHNQTGLSATMDTAVAGAGQPIYTAAPIFEGMDDPVPVRLALLPGSRDTAAMVIPDKDASTVRECTAATSVGASLDDGWGEPPPDDDCLAMKCPQCGAKAEFPDCESCGFTFAQPNPATTGGESQAASLSVDVPLALDDQALLNKISQSKNGSAFDALWAGDLSNCNGDASAADLALCNALAFWTGKDAPRMDRLFRQSRLMRPKWDAIHDPAAGRTYGQMTVDKAIADCRNTFSGKKQGTKATTKPRAKADQCGDDANELNPWRGTDDANADLLLGLHGADIRFCPPWDKWILWSGSHWRIDNRLDIDRLAADVPKMIRNEAVRLTQQRSGVLLRMAELQSQFPLPPEYDKLFLEQKALGDKSEYLLKLADSLERIGKRGAMLTAARHKVVIHYSDLDKGHFLLNASNGTVDLQTGVLRPHERVDLLTHDVEIPYLQNATAPAWLAFLHSTFGGDADLIQFVQRAIGCSLTGDVREQVLLICHGVGSNGKSVFLNILRKLLGTLAIQAAPDLLMGDLKHRHPTEQADLFGKRAIICQETGDGQRFNEKLVKQLTGGDGIRARRMHEDFWEFNPTHKLWLSTNHKPEIKGTDHAIWRRIRLIPFNVKFTDDGEPRKNPDMERQLTAELPGILAWAVAGCLDWQRNGLGKAAAVEAATAGYQAEMDVLAAWIGECCVVGKRFEAKAADLYRSYVQWAEQSGEYPDKQRKFGMRLTERGFIGFTNNGAWWRGIGIVSDRYGSAEGTEGTEPKNAIFEKNKNNPFYVAEKAFFGSAGSVPSVNTPPETSSPPVDATDTGEKWESFH